MYTKLVLIVLFLIISLSNLLAQVTIGSNTPPSNGAILDIKERSVVDGSANSTKGLGLPRVSLTAIDDLYPCADNTASNRSSHIGLTVYNVTDNSGNISTLKNGLYFWDGETWQPIGVKAAQGFGPWYQIDNPALPSRDVDSDSYLDAKAVIGGTEIVNDATLTVHDNKGSSTSTATFGTSNAALNLSASNKGFIPPRVQLTGNTDTTTVPVTINDKGLMVYNISSSEGMSEGLHIWDGMNWQKYISQLPPDVASNLVEMTTTSFIAPSGNSLGENSMILPMEPLAMVEDGSYAFALRLYGSLVKDPNSSATQLTPRCALYVFLTKADGTILDSSELNFYYFTSSDFTGVDQKSTSTVILTGKGIKQGETLYIKVSCFNSSGGNRTFQFQSAAAPRAARTSLTFWKL